MSFRRITFFKSGYLQPVFQYSSFHYFCHPKWSKVSTSKQNLFYLNCLQKVCVCVGGSILVCLYLVLLEIFEIIKKHLGHRQCLLSLNNSLLFFFKQKMWCWHMYLRNRIDSMQIECGTLESYCLDPKSWPLDIRRM